MLAWRVDLISKSYIHAWVFCQSCLRQDILQGKWDLLMNLAFMMSLPVSHPPAETPMPDDYLCDPPVDSKRYAVDPSHSAFNIMTSQYPTKHTYAYRGSSCSTPVAVCRKASSPGSFQDGNRNGKAVCSCHCTLFGIPDHINKYKLKAHIDFFPSLQWCS